MFRRPPAPAARTAVLAAALALVPAAAAHAQGPPIMPLSDVQPGMHCQGASVVRGTTIATFAVDVIDVVQGDPGAGQPYILIRASGPAVDGTGLGEGFSGSPVSCPGADGKLRIAGAVSEGVGQYGNDVALATPIEQVLGEPVDPPAETRTDPALFRRTRPLATPLSFGGLSPRVGAMLQAAAAKAHRVVYAAPAAPRDAAFPPQTLQPGSSLAVGLASGDFTAGAIGTVTYVDGSSVWGFGHPLDGAGRRSLLLEDAYVYSVISNPVGSSDLQTYKYAAPGHDLGTLTEDGISGVAGRLGALPATFPLKIVATDLDTGRTRVATSTIADESDLGLPTGSSALSQVGAAGVAQMAYVALDGAPLRQSGRMCVRITVREYAKPMRFCNTYVGGAPSDGSGLGGGPMVSDFTSATGALDAFNFGPLHVTAAEVDMRLRRSLRLAYLLKVARAPAVMRRGRTYRVTLQIQRQNGPKSLRQVAVHVPRGTPAGPRDLTFTGTAADLNASPSDALTAVLDVTDSSDPGGSGTPEDDAGPRTPAGVAKEIAAIHRPDGVTAAFLRPGASSSGSQSASAAGGGARQVLRDPELRIAGSAHRTVTVR